jgi:hypothetical protein
MAKKLTLSQQCLQVRAKKRAAKEAKKRAEKLDLEAKKAERALLDRMEAEGADGHKADGTNFVPAETLYPSVTDRAEFVAWAEIHAPELIEYKERKELLGQKIREALDNGEQPPPGTNFYVKQYLSQRAA